MKKNKILIFVMQVAEKITITASDYIDTREYLSMEGTATRNKLDIAASAQVIKDYRKRGIKFDSPRIKEITVNDLWNPFHINCC